MMKNVSISLILIVVVLLASCKKKEDDLTVGFSEEIQKIVPSEILDDVKSKGMAVNEGRRPPKLDGVFYINPFELLSPYGANDGWSKGYIIPGYTYRFSNQTADNNFVEIDYKNGGGDTGSGLGAFLSGNGNLFSIFAEVTGRSNGVDYVMLKIISGEITSNGIKNFQESLYMKEKSEGSGAGQLIPVNTGRIWFENDFISESRSSYRKADAGENHVEVRSGGASTR